MCIIYNNIISTAIVGSKTFNLNDENSDTDVLALVNSIPTKEQEKEYSLRFSKGIDIHYCQKDEWLVRLQSSASFLQALFVFSSFELEDSIGFFNFLREERENYVQANKQKIFINILSKQDINERIYKISGQAAANRIRYLHLLNDYADYGAWQKIFVANDKTRENLLKIKYSCKEYQEVEKEFLFLKNQVLRKDSFYLTPQDEKYNEWFFKTGCEILGTSYEDFIKQSFLLCRSSSHGAAVDNFIKNSNLR